MSKRGLLFGSVGFAVLVILPFIVLSVREYGTSQKYETGGRTVRFAGEDWGAPNPFLFYPRGPGYVNMSYVFDSLAWKDEKGVTGLLAESWEASRDMTVYTFALRPDARWHDGAPVGADDVAFTFEYFKKHIFPWSRLDIVEKVRVLDDRRVEFKLAHPYAPFLVNVAGTVPIIPRHVWEKVEDPRTFREKQAFIGSGPFRFESYSKEHGTYSFVASEDYYLGKLRVRKLEFVAVGDPLLALKKGEIDGLSFWTRQLDAIGEFSDDPGYRVVKGPGNWVLKLMMNLKDPVFGKLEVRRALASALDLADMAGRIKHGHVTPGSAGFIPPSSEWHNPGVRQYPYDLEKARALLEDAGFHDADDDGVRENANGGKLSYTLLTSPNYVREADYIAGQARLIGILLTVKTLPVPTLDPMLKEGRFLLAVNGHGGIGGDPDMLRTNFCEGWLWDTGGYSNDELAELGRQQMVESDIKKRRALICRMQEIIAEDLPVIPLWYPDIYFVYNPAALDGWFYTPGGVGLGIPTINNKLVYVERKDQ